MSFKANRRRTWFVERRLDYIAYRLLSPGHINRKDLMRTFDISTIQACYDLTLFRRLYPWAMRYNTSERCYEATAKVPACIRAMNPERCQAWARLGWR